MVQISNLSRCNPTYLVGVGIVPLTYISTYGDNFDRWVSFCIRNFNTGISGESWFEDEDEDAEDYKEPTEEDSWAMTLDYYDIEGPYDAWDMDFWNLFGKYNEQLESCADALFDSMVDDDEVMKWCFCGRLGDEGGLVDCEYSNKNGENYYVRECSYTNEEGRFLKMPIYVGENTTGTERRVESNLLIGIMSEYECLNKIDPYKILEQDDHRYENQNLLIGEWLVDLWGCARKGSLIGDYCLGGYDQPEWEGDSTLNLLRFWKLTDIKQNIRIGKRSYTMFCSGAKCWVIDDDKADREEDFYPLFFTSNIPND